MEINSLVNNWLLQPTEAILMDWLDKNPESKEYISFQKKLKIKLLPYNTTKKTYYITGARKNETNEKDILICLQILNKYTKEIRFDKSEPVILIRHSELINLIKSSAKSKSKT